MAKRSHTCQIQRKEVSSTQSNRRMSCHALSPEVSPDPRKEKRRAQVREAQARFRGRKEKSLDELRMRTDYQAVMIGELRIEIGRLRERLSQYEEHEKTVPHSKAAALEDDIPALLALASQRSPPQEGEGQLITRMRETSISSDTLIQDSRDPSNCAPGPASKPMLAYAGQQAVPSVTPCRYKGSPDNTLHQGEWANVDVWRGCVPARKIDRCSPTTAVAVAAADARLSHSSGSDSYQSSSATSEAKFPRPPFERNVGSAPIVTAQGTASTHTPSCHALQPVHLTDVPAWDQSNVEEPDHIQDDTAAAIAFAHALNSGVIACAAPASSSSQTNNWSTQDVGSPSVAKRGRAYTTASIASGPGTALACGSALLPSSTHFAQAATAANTAPAIQVHRTRQGPRRLQMFQHGYHSMANSALQSEHKITSSPFRPSMNGHVPSGLVTNAVAASDSGLLSTLVSSPMQRALSPADAGRTDCSSSSNGYNNEEEDEQTRRTNAALVQALSEEAAAVYANSTLLHH